MVVRSTTFSCFTINYLFSGFQIVHTNSLPIFLMNYLPFSEFERAPYIYILIMMILTLWQCFSQFVFLYRVFGGFSGSSVVKNLPPMQETQVQSLGREDPLEKEMAIHSSILAWEIPWTEEPCRLQSMESQKSPAQLSN